jgi:hypothetical protein
MPKFIWKLIWVVVIWLIIGLGCFNFVKKMEENDCKITEERRRKKQRFIEIDKIEYDYSNGDEDVFIHVIEDTLTKVRYMLIFKGAHGLGICRLEKN